MEKTDVLNEFLSIFFKLQKYLNRHDYYRNSYLIYSIITKNNKF